MKDYTPRLRTAVVFAGSGTSGAYHAGVLKALDESGVKIDLLVGSGVGALAAAFGAIAAGSRLYGEAGFWDGLRRRSVVRLRPAVTLALVLLGLAGAAFALPVALTLLAAVASPLLIVLEVIRPGLVAALLQWLADTGASLASPYLALLTLPIFLLALASLGFFAWAYRRDRRRVAEVFESLWDVTPGRSRLRRQLAEATRGPALASGPASAAELGKRFVAVAEENRGQPGFRELILRVLDLDANRVVPYMLLEEERKASFLAARGLKAASRDELRFVDLRSPGGPEMFLDAVVSALHPGSAGPVLRGAVPRMLPRGGEQRRLADVTLAGGCGIAEAIAAGAEQVIVAIAVPPGGAPATRRRGLLARHDAALAAVERQAVERELEETERINRVIETVGHDLDGTPAWQDPATGRSLRAVALYPIRPSWREVGPLELDGSFDAASEVGHGLGELLEQGRTDTYRLFIEPIVGAAPVTVSGVAIATSEGA